MKRFTLKKEIRYTEGHFSLERKTIIRASMLEDVTGEWVTWADANAAIEFVLDQLPERRIAKLEKRLGLVSEGKCPECRQKIRDYAAPVGSFAPEAWVTLREDGIDPANGHKETCSLRR